MGKGSGIFGNFRGKVGNVVGSIADGQQIVRAYNGSPKNPKSAAQAMQRMKMRPASSFYSAFETVLSNGFEGVAYGSASRRYFMSKAMSMASGFPYQFKDDPRVLPGEYLVAKGSLSSITDLFSEGQASGSVQDLTFQAPQTAVEAGTPATTIAQYDAALAELGVQSGEQITVMGFTYKDAALKDLKPFYARGVVGRESDFALADFYSGANSLQFAEASGADVRLAIFDDFINVWVPGLNVAAVAVIRSFESTKWLRSHEFMKLRGVVKQQLFDAALYEAVLAGYMHDVALTYSDWYLNGANSLPFNGRLVVRNFGAQACLVLMVVTQGKVRYVGLINTTTRAIILQDGSDGTLPAGAEGYPQEVIAWNPQWMRYV